SSSNFSTISNFTDTTNPPTSLPNQSQRAGDIIQLAATLSGAQVNGESITFTITDPNNTVVTIGQVLTNSSGVANISYRVPLNATLGNYTLDAYYAGNTNKNLQPSYKALLLLVTTPASSGRPCSTDAGSGAEMCVIISSTSTAP